MKKLRLLTVLVFVLLSFAATGFLSPLDAGEVRIRILHVNDFHGFAHSYRPFGTDEQ